jgi:hypothetical protein
MAALTTGTLVTLVNKITLIVGTLLTLVTTPPTGEVVTLLTKLTSTTGTLVALVTTLILTVRALVTVVSS